ncbi:aquaporin FA-CHIP [Notolabrus celidotus]|uniref:aquaporin FA-CHIP n=1 Tax=Notolabrus celidotus TaxID=1203425 RepID=UPI00148F5AE0|nr:aquaporin FA-CHIP [Notolabrus celidotus]
MLIHRCLRLILSDVWTLSCLHRFLLEFLGTALFLSISLSAVLICPPAAGRLQLDLKIWGNLGYLCSQSNRSEQITLSNLCNLSNKSNLSNHLHLTPTSVQPSSCLQVALVFGLSVALTAICVGGEVNLNPVVTLAMTLTLRLRLWRAALYVIGQLLGGVASAALLLGLTGDVTPALNKVAPGVQLHLAIIVETLAAFQLVLVVLAAVDTHLPAVMSYLLVGLSVSLGHLMAVSPAHHLQIKRLSLSISL